jgi:hypothetical protein
MTARNQNPPQPLSAGDSFVLIFPITFTGGATSLAGATAKWAIYTNRLNGEKKLEKTAADGVTLALVEGVWTMTVPVDAGDTDALVGDFYHEATVSIAPSYRKTIAVGTITFTNTRNDEA